MTYLWYMCRCIGEVRKLAAGGGHSAVLTDAFTLKELCEFRLADSVTLSNASEIEDVAYRTGSDALARLCERLRYRKYILLILLTKLVLFCVLSINFPLVEGNHCNGYAKHVCNSP